MAAVLRPAPENGVRSATGALGSVGYRLPAEAWLRLALGLVLLIATVLRLFHLGVPSLWLDEIGQALVAKMVWPDILAGVQGHHAAAPLDYLVSGLVVRLSDFEWVMRLPAAVWGVLAVYWVFRLGKRLGMPVAGLAAALLLALSPLHLRYSQELRFYSLFVLFTLVATEALWRAHDIGSRRAWALYAVLLTLGLYTHYYMALVIAFHAAWLAVQTLIDRSQSRNREHWRWAWRGFALAVILALLLFLPWYVFFGMAQPRGDSLFATPDLQLRLIGSAVVHFSGGESRWWAGWLALAGVGWLAVLRRNRAGAVLLACWVLIPLPLSILIDQQQGYFFAVRQILYALPAYLLLIGCGVEFLAHLAGRSLARVSARSAGVAQALVFMLLTGALLASVAPHTRAYYLTETREDWRSIGEMLSANLSIGDSVVLFNAGPSVAYYSPRARSYMREAWTLADLERHFATGRPLWVLTTPYLEQLSDAAAIRAWLRNHPALVFDFDMGMVLYYMRNGYEVDALWPALSNMNLGQHPALWVAKAQAFRSIDRATSRDAYEYAADLTPSPLLRARYLAEAGDIAFFQQLPDQALVLYDQALANYRRVSELLPEAYDLYYRIGLMYEQLGQADQARQWWQDYLAHEPAGVRASDARARLDQNP